MAWGLAHLCAALVGVAVLGTASAQAGECDVPRNESRPDICVYVRALENGCVGDG